MAEEAKEITTKYCSTCEQDVPAANFEMHTIHCQRFLTICPHCKESVNKNDLDEHIEENHSQVKCEGCGESVEKIELESHKETSCKHRSLKCEYCEISLPASDMDEHRELCGSRTEECETCKTRILVKNLELHMASGCQTPDTGTKTNNQTTVKTKVRKPESLFYDNSPSQSIIRFNRDGVGFSIHHQFLDSKYTDKNEVKRSDFRNGCFNESLHPDQTSMESTSFSPVKQNSTSMKSFHEGKLRKENAKRYDNVPRKFEVHHSTDFNSKKPFNTQEVLPDFGIPDSDSDDDGTNEKKPLYDLADDTPLPCEFCKEELPADSLAFHQATCAEMPPTPRVRPLPRPQPSFSQASFPVPGFSGRGFSDHPISDLQPVMRESALHTSQLQQASATTVSSEEQDMGQDFAPCEFCDKSCSLGDLAVHQITCGKNPNLEHFESPERHPAHSPPPCRKTPPPKTTTNPPASPSRQMRRPLAPTFSDQPQTPPQLETSTSARPNTNSRLVDNGDVKTDTHKSKRSGKAANDRPPAKNSPSIDKAFHEVNVLGADQRKTFATPPRVSNGRKPYGTPFGDSNRDPFGDELSFKDRSSFGNGSRIADSGIGRGNVFTGSDHFRGAKQTRNSQGNKRSGSQFNDPEARYGSGGTQSRDCVGPFGGDGLSLEGRSSFGNGSRAAGDAIGRGNVFTSSNSFRGTAQSRNPQGNKQYSFQFNSSETRYNGDRGSRSAQKSYGARGGQTAGRQPRGGGTVTIQTRKPRNPYSGDQHRERDDGLTYDDLGLNPPLECTSPQGRHRGRGTVSIQTRNLRNPYSSDQHRERDDGLTYDDLGLNPPLECTSPQGRPRGGGTVTIQTHKPRNPYSGDQHRERDDGLTYDDVGLNPPLERTSPRPSCPEGRNRGRGGGRRPRFGKGGSRGGKHRNQRSPRGRR